MKIQLRPYQNLAIVKLREAISAGKKKIILCAPTGAGKTFIFSYMAMRAIEKGRRVLIVSDRTELMKQASGSLGKLGLIPIEIKAGKKLSTLNGSLYNAMVETLGRRMRNPEYQELLASFDLIIFDEAHKQAFNKLFKYISDKTIVIGATATPHREGSQKSLSDFYEDLVEVISIGELVKKGYLAQPQTYGVDVDLSNVRMERGDYSLGDQADNYSKNRIFKGVVDNYRRICESQKTLIFSAKIASSIELIEEFKSKGHDAKHLDSTMSSADRNQILSWFSSTDNAILSNVGILTTGFDEPSIKTIILYRATTSLPLFLQMTGRGSRVTESKRVFNILDFGENIKRFGFWEDDRKWTLEKKKKKKGKQVAPVKSCPSCDALIYASAVVCKYCGEDFPKTREEKEKEEVIARLRLLTPRQLRQEASSSDIKKKAEMAKAGLVSPFWVLHQMTDWEEAQYFTELMGYKKGFWHYNLHRFPKLKMLASAGR